MRETTNSRRGRTRNIVLWVLQIAAAAVYFMTGWMKLSGNPQMVGLFETIGIGQWFRYLTGLLEVGSAVLLLIPGFAGAGALVLIPVTIGAVLTHRFIVGGNPAEALGLLAAVAIVAWGRRAEIAGLAGRRRRR